MVVTHLELIEHAIFLQIVNTPMFSSQFLHLKFLDIDVFGEMDFDFLSPGSSFFDASPSLETFKLNVSQYCFCKYICNYAQSAYPSLVFHL
jgi:hypothetical protein